MRKADGLIDDVMSRVLAVLSKYRELRAEVQELKECRQMQDKALVKALRELVHERAVRYEAEMRMSGVMRMSE